MQGGGRSLQEIPRKENNGLNLLNQDTTHCSPLCLNRTSFCSENFNELNLQLHASSVVDNPYSFSIINDTSFSSPKIEVKFEGLEEYLSTVPPYYVDYQTFSGKKTLATVIKECDLTGQYIHRFNSDIADFSFHANPGDIIQTELCIQGSDSDYNTNIYLNDKCISSNWLSYGPTIGDVEHYNEIDFYLTSSIPERFTPSPPISIIIDTNLVSTTQPITINIPYPEIGIDTSKPFMVSLACTLLDSEQNILGNYCIPLKCDGKSVSDNTELQITPKLKDSKLSYEIILSGINGYDFSQKNLLSYNYKKIIFVLKDIKLSKYVETVVFGY